MLGSCCTRYKLGSSGGVGRVRWRVLDCHQCPFWSLHDDPTHRSLAIVSAEIYSTLQNYEVQNARSSQLQIEEQITSYYYKIENEKNSIRINYLGTKIAWKIQHVQNDGIFTLEFGNDATYQSTGTLYVDESNSGTVLYFDAPGSSGGAYQTFDQTNHIFVLQTE